MAVPKVLDSEVLLTFVSLSLAPCNKVLTLDMQEFGAITPSNPPAMMLVGCKSHCEPSSYNSSPATEDLFAYIMREYSRLIETDSSRLPCLIFRRDDGLR